MPKHNVTEQGNPGQVRWRLRSDMTGLDAALDTVPAILVGQRGTVIKRGPVRVVHSSDCDSLPFGIIVKHLTPRSLSGLAGRFTAPKLKTEYRNMELAGEGPKPLAWGTAGLGEVLVMERLENVRELREIDLESLSCPVVRSSFIHRLAGFMADIHHRGLWHGDFHYRNLMLQGSGPEDFKPVLIDMHKLCIHNRPLDLRRRLTMIAGLGAGFVLNTPVHWRIAFLRSYWNLWNDPGKPSLRRFVELAWLTFARSAKALWRDRDKRPMRRGKYFKPVRSGTVHGWRTATEKAEELTKLFFDGRLKSDVFLKDSASSTVTRCETPCGVVVLKRNNVKKALSPIKDLFRRSRAFRNWQAAHSLATRHVHVPESHFALVNCAMGILPAKSHFCCEFLHGYQDAEKFMVEARERFGVEGFRLVRRAFADLMADTLGWMAWTGFAHRDMKAANIMLSWPKGETPSLAELPEALSGMRACLIDFDGLRRLGHLNRNRSLVSMCMRLCHSIGRVEGFTRRDGLRFLKRFLRRCEMPIGPVFDRCDPTFRHSFRTFVTEVIRRIHLKGPHPLFP